MELDKLNTRDFIQITTILYKRRAISQPNPNCTQIQLYEFAADIAVN